METETDAKFPGGSFIRISIILLYKAMSQSVQLIHYKTSESSATNADRFISINFSASHKFLRFFTSVCMSVNRWLRLSGHKQLSKHRVLFHFFIA